MISIYVQGSKSYGLGHLSRITPIIYSLKENGISIQVYLDGDDFGSAYLNYNEIEHLCLNNKDSTLLRNDDFWIIDSTDIRDVNVITSLENAKKVILLSPKFNVDKIHLISEAYIRSDPFQLAIENKHVSNDYISYNHSFHSNKLKTSIAIVLSGGDASIQQKELIDSIINDPHLNFFNFEIKLFLGGSYQFNFHRKTNESYKIDITAISTFRSVWSYSDQIDLMIVGNGIIVDECIQEGKDFIVYSWNEKNAKIKSENTDIIQPKFFTNIDLLKLELKFFLENNQKIDKTTSQKYLVNNKLSEKLLSILKKSIN